MAIKNVSDDVKIRGLSEQFKENWKNSKWKEFYETHDKELFLGIRNDYINFYYLSQSMAKITYLKRRKTFKAEIASAYLPACLQNESEINIQQLCDEYDEIKSLMKKYSEDHGLREKRAQHMLVLNNNRGKETTNWYCIDIEYIKHRKNIDEDNFGRFDIVAVSKEKPYKIALIELKTGTTAITGKNGVIKHLVDYEHLFRKDVYKNHLKKVFCSIINNQIALFKPDENISPVLETDLANKPEIYFIILNLSKDEFWAEFSKKDQKKAISQFSKQILDEDITISHNIFDLKTLLSALSFEPVFLFSEDDGSNIYDILYSKEYKEGL